MNVGLYLGSTSKYHEIRVETDEAVNLLLLWHSSNHSNNEDAHCFSSTWAKSRNVPKWECRNDTWQPINQVEYLYMTKGITLCVILQLPSMVNLGIVYNMWHYEDIMRIILLSVWGYNARHPNSHFLFCFSEKKRAKVMGRMIYRMICPWRFVRNSEACERNFLWIQPISLPHV